VRCTIFYHTAAGFAIDRLEGDGIKKIRALHTAFEKRWLSLGTAAIKKIISMAAWWSIIFFIACGVGYLTLMCIIGFFQSMFT
jgi:hypothetical protein